MVAPETPSIGGLDVFSIPHKLALTFIVRIPILPCFLLCAVATAGAQMIPGQSIVYSAHDPAAIKQYQTNPAVVRGMVNRLVLAATGQPDLAAMAQRYRYHRRAFLVPPWPDIHVTDDARRHGLDEAIAEYDRLVGTYPALGYDVVVLPKVGVAERADIVLAAPAGDQP